MFNSKDPKALKVLSDQITQEKIYPEYIYSRLKKHERANQGIAVLFLGVFMPVSLTKIS